MTLTPSDIDSLPVYPARFQSPSVAALFVRATSHYKTMPGVDCFDSKRDALTWRGGVPGVFHPPCRGWGKLRHLSKHPASELELARWSVDMVRRFGGVLEHPSSSRLWAEIGCASFGLRDDFGGVLVPVLQSWWGHRAPKNTSLYIVGANLSNVYFPSDGAPTPSGLIQNMCTAERESTPPEFAKWLVELAASCQPHSV